MQEAFYRQRPILTVRLRRLASGQLETTHFLPPFFQPMPSVQCDWGELGKTLEFGALTGLDALNALLDRGLPVHLSQYLTGVPAMRIGSLLFEMLFPSSATQNPLNQLAGSQNVDIHPTRHAVRLRIEASDPALLGLPWRLTSYQGKRLIDYSWTFEVVPELHPRGPLTLVVPGTVLIVAPEHAGMLNVSTTAHVQDIRAVLARASPAWATQDNGLVRITRSRAELLYAIRAAPPFLLYYYGHGAISDGQLRLHLGGPGEPRDELSLDDLLRAFKQCGHAPNIAFINGCMAAASGWMSAGHQLSPEVPLVVTQRTTAFSKQSSLTAIRWFAAVLEEHQEPVIALHRLVDQDSRDYQWATLCLHTSFSDVQIQASDNAGLDPRSPLRLDRTEPKDAINGRITRLLRSPEQRVEAVVAYAAPRNHVEQFGWQARDFLKREAGHRFSFAEVRFPAERDRLGERLDLALREALKAREEDTLEQALRAATSTQARLLWLEWTYDPVEQPADQPIPLTDWLSYCCDFIARACPPDRRVVNYIGFEASRDDHSDLRAAVHDQHARLSEHQIRFGCTALPALPSVEENDLIHFFTQHTSDHSCPPGSRHKAARLIYKLCRGDYQAAVDLLRRGETLRWSLVFFDELDGTMPKERPSKRKAFA